VSAGKFTVGGMRSEHKRRAKCMGKNGDESERDGKGVDESQMDGDSEMWVTLMLTVATMVATTVTTTTMR
jgi:hypothetical protein